MHHMDADKAQEEKAWRQLHKNVASCIEQILEVTSHKPCKSDEQNMLEK